MEARRFYWSIRRLVDSDLSQSSRPLSTLLPALPFALVGVVDQAGARTSSAHWVAAIMLAIPAAGFIAWRGLRLFKAMTVRGDRHYDRVGRYALSADYLQSESATYARQVREREEKQRRAPAHLRWMQSRWRSR